MAGSIPQGAVSTPAVARQTAGQRLRRVFGPDWQVAFPFVLPMVLLMAALIVVPVFDAIRLSFTTHTIFNTDRYVGLQNYQDLLHDQAFRDAVKVTIIFTSYSIIFKVVIGLISALLLHNLRRGRAVLTGLILLPWIIPTVSAAFTWRLLYDPIFGGLNKALVVTHLGQVMVFLHLTDRVPAAWLGQANLALPSIVAVNVWKGIPFFTLNLLAGLKAIDKDLYEAAAVDGATAWERFLNVTLPGLRYVLLVTALLSTIWTFNSFDIIYLLTGGGPGGTTRPFVIFAYEKAIQGLQFGPGAAVALLMVPIMAVFIFFLARYMRRSDRQERETGLDRVLAAYGRYFLWIGIAAMALLLYLLNAGMFIRAAAILAVILVLAFGFGRIVATLTEGVQLGAAGSTKRSRWKMIAGRVPAWITMALLLFFVLGPFYWMIITAFKTELQQTAQLGNVFWPQPWSLQQFHKLLGEHPFWTWFRNTVVVATCTTVLAVTLAALSGYALARLRFRGAQPLTGIVLLTYLVPGALLFIPLYQILSALHLIDSLGALIITYPTFALPYASWLLMGYFRSIPEELEQAAMIDGATRFQAFTRVTLPLAKPALLAVALFTFTNACNEFLFAFIFISKENLKTLPVGLQSLLYGDVIPWGQLMAGSILIAVPVVVIYGYAQRFLVEGLTAGSVKG
ncbi:MAG: ABC transporter permease [Thermomicrobiales bacterium]